MFVPLQNSYGETPPPNMMVIGNEAFGKLLGLDEFTSREGNGTPLQYSCLENPMDRGAWKAAVHGVAKSQSDLAAADVTRVACGSHEWDSSV